MDLITSTTPWLTAFKIANGYGWTATVGNRGGGIPIKNDADAAPFRKIGLASSNHEGDGTTVNGRTMSKQ